MNPQETAEKAVEIYDKKPFAAFIVTILLLCGAVYYFIIRDQLHDYQQEREQCRKENQELYQLIIKSRLIINEQNSVIETQQSKQK